MTNFTWVTTLKCRNCKGQCTADQRSSVIDQIERILADSFNRLLGLFPFATSEKWPMKKVIHRLRLITNIWEWETLSLWDSETVRIWFSESESDDLSVCRRPYKKIACSSAFTINQIAGRKSFFRIVETVAKNKRRGQRRWRFEAEKN